MLFIRSRYDEDTVGFSVFLHACPLEFNTGDTTVWPQSEIQWHNEPSFFFRLYRLSPFNSPGSQHRSCYTFCVAVSLNTSFSLFISNVVVPFPFICLIDVRMDNKSCFPILAMFLFTSRFRFDLSGIMQKIVTCAWEEIIALIMPPASHNLAQQWSILLLTGHGVHYLFPNAKNTRVGLIKHSHKDELSRFPLSRRFHSVTHDLREREYRIQA